MTQVTVVGAGLAGCEAAWQLAERGIDVRLLEMKPGNMTPAHESPNFAELVCSNSLRSDQLENAVGLLKAELRCLGSLILRAADENRVDAGGALAVDRQAFSHAVTHAIRTHPHIQVESREVTQLPDGYTIIATGPLTSDAFAAEIRAKVAPESGDFLFFYDAAAPIVSRESIDLSRAFFASRYGRGTPDYINCGMSEHKYTAFYEALITARTAVLHAFEDARVFEGCMPIETMAKRGRDTLCYGPLKPVGLEHPETGLRYHAVVQLRRENAAGSMYNLVGFQTNLAFGEQKRVFSMIPGLENAEFLRYGVMHRNTYLDAPRLLDRYYRLRSEPRIRFAGQITGVEGYVESTASGLLAAIELAREIRGETPIDFPPQTAIGALANYISDESVTKFQPMNINFGLIPPLDYRVKGKANRNAALAERALGIVSEKRGL